MVQVIIATHGNYAVGLKHSIEFIMGKQANLYALPVFTADCPSVEEGLRSLPSADGDGQIFLTDLRGGSVNTTIMSLVSNRQNAYVISGVNLPLMIQLLVGLDNDNEMDVIDDAIQAGQQGIELCHLDDKSMDAFDSF